MGKRFTRIPFHLLTIAILLLGGWWGDGFVLAEVKTSEVSMADSLTSNIDWLGHDSFRFRG